MGPCLVRFCVIAACLFLTAFTFCCSPTTAQDISLAKPPGLPFDGPTVAEPDANCVGSDPVTPRPVRFTVRCAMVNVAPPTTRVHSTLGSLGPPGALIEQARVHAIQILSSQNACNAWFREADPDVVAVLESLEYTLHDGPRYVLAYRMDSGETLLRQPYSAITDEGAGRGATIVVNRNGPFFVGAADTFQIQSRNWRGRFVGRRSLTIGNFAGATLPAQITTLLHELAHVIGRIPDDSDDSTFQSPENTERVLYYCRGAIKANLRHPGR